MYLVVDCGNSAIKLYLFEKDVLVKNQRYPIHEIDACIAYIAAQTSIQQAIFCSVSCNSTVLGRIRDIIPCIEFSYNTPIPLINTYESKQTLGLDRLAAAVGAEYIAPECNKLIFDFGTAITIDFVSKHKTFEGGNISPGLYTRSKSLHQNTELLPNISDFSTISLTGKTTQQAIQNGVVLGILYEIEGYISAYYTKYEKISLFFTGGDANFFEKMVKIPIFAEPNLIAFGLYRILQNNADK